MHLSAGPRIRIANSRPVRPDGRFVLYWMIAARRPASNFALDRAVAWASALGRPLVILEALRVDYAWASDRLHRFILDGMRDNRRAFRGTQALYYPYVEPAAGSGKGLLSALAAEASVVVTDEFPCFFLPRMVNAAATRLDVRLEVVDSNGLVPLVRERTFAAAAHYRRFMQKRLVAASRPTCPPIIRFAARGCRDSRQCPPRSAGDGHRPEHGCCRPPLRRLPHCRSTTQSHPSRHREVLPRRAGAFRSFVAKRLTTYHEARNHPDLRGTSRLSPYLHFGHVSAHQVFNAVMRKERWTVGRLPQRATGSREGWWGVGPGAEAFLDQLVVWRELAVPHMRRASRTTTTRTESLPAWARQTLEAHLDDERPHLYSRKQFETAATHDPLWNAAQREMLRDGWFHNYVRMLWGKKILEWSATPQLALAVMEALMNRWSLDGRNPNWYAGYYWTVGRYDRPWPERPIYGRVRSMSSENVARKIHVTDYLRRYAPKSGA